LKESNKLINELIKNINKYKDKVRIMEVCGTHTMEIFRTGIKDLLPENIELISGPGCPVCVTPQSYIDYAIEIAKKGATILTFGDMLRVKGSSMSLEDIKAEGADIRIIYSPLDCKKIAALNPNKENVFLGIGFETTTPIIALMINIANQQNINNLFILSGMKMIIPALNMLCQDKKLKVDGFLLPGHVSAIIGVKPYEFLANRYNKACAVAGFTAEDILLGVESILSQIKEANIKVENTYKRVVSHDGNTKAYNEIFDVFEPVDSLWRGLGNISNSGLKLKQQNIRFDAKEHYNLGNDYEVLPKGCRCGEVIKGLITPCECELFGKVCNLENPIGACMISSEGSCSAYYKYSTHH